jgi:hypothetical protein
VGDVEYSTVVPYAVAFRDYAFEPDGEIETRILDNVSVLPVILVDVGSSRQDQRLARCRYFSAGRKKNAKQLRTRNRRLRNNLQVLGIEPELLTALGTIASVALNDLAWSLQLKPGVEEFAALGA